MNAGPALADFADTAALILNLDLVITVDTSVCHLAASLGIPTWTLLHSITEYRWLEDRSDSPWYPTMRLFHQPCPGDWMSLTGKVKEALKLQLGQS